MLPFKMIALNDKEQRNAWTSCEDEAFYKRFV